MPEKIEMHFKNGSSECVIEHCPIVLALRRLKPAPDSLEEGITTSRDLGLIESTEHLNEGIFPSPNFRAICISGNLTKSNHCGEIIFSSRSTSI